MGRNNDDPRAGLISTGVSSMGKKAWIPVILASSEACNITRFKDKVLCTTLHGVCRSADYSDLQRP